MDKKKNKDQRSSNKPKASASPLPPGSNKVCVEISDDDIKEAFKEVEGYIDITLEDFKEIYLLAVKHASEKLRLDILADSAGKKD